MPMSKYYRDAVLILIGACMVVAGGYALFGCGGECNWKNGCLKPDGAVVAAQVSCEVPDAGQPDCTCPDGGDVVVLPGCGVICGL